MRQRTILCIAALAFVTAMVVPAMGFAQLKVGEKAPAFEMKGSDGKLYHLADYLGKKAVVIAWYPKAFTSG